MKNYKYKYYKFIKKDYNNIIVWQINNQKRLIIQIDRETNEVFVIILNMYVIYI